MDRSGKYGCHSGKGAVHSSHINLACGNINLACGKVTYWYLYYDALFYYMFCDGKGMKV